MELILQQGLPHQQKAIDAVCDALEGVTSRHLCSSMKIHRLLWKTVGCC